MAYFYFYIPGEADDCLPVSLGASDLTAFLGMLGPLVSPKGWAKKLTIGRMYPGELAPFEMNPKWGLPPPQSFAPIFDLTTGQERVVAYLLSRRPWWKSLLPSDEEGGYYAAP